QSVAHPDYAAHEDLIDLREYFYLFKHNLGTILGATLAFSAFAFLIIFSLNPVYSGRATLLIESNNANVVSIEEVYQLGMNKSEYYASQFEVLKSTALAQQIVTKHSDYFDGLLEENSNSVFSKAMAIFKGSAEAPPLE